MEITSGIYMIKNKENGKVYIGQTNNFKNRFRQHKQSFRRKDHKNKHFQRAWEKYGEENFVFSIIEYCDLDIINERESFWVNKLESYDSLKGYNIMLPSKDKKKFTHNEETKEKLRLHGAEQKYNDEELISLLHEYYYHYGKIPSQRDIESNKNFPSQITFFNRFSSFQNALKEAGLFVDSKLFHRERYKEEDVLKCFEIFIEKHSRFPTSKERILPENNFPTSNVISRFYSIEEIRKIFGYSKEQLKEKEKKESIDMLKKLYEKEGFISARLIDMSKITKSGVFYRNNFGNLKNACEIAGVPYAQHMN